MKKTFLWSFILVSLVLSLPQPAFSYQTYGDAFNLAYELYVNNSFYLARNDFNSLLCQQAIPAPEPDALLLSADSSYYLDSDRVAMKDFYTLRLKYPDAAYYRDAYYREGEILFRNGAYGKAISSFHQVINRGADDDMHFKAEFLTGESYMALKQYKEAAECFSDLAADQELFFCDLALLEWAKDLYLYGAPKHSLDKIKQFEDTYPHSRLLNEALYWKARDCEDLIDITDMQAAYEQLFKISPEKSIWESEALYGLGLAQEKQAHYDTAMEKFSSVADRNVNSEIVSRSLFHIGFCLAKTGAYDKAKEFFQKALSQSSQSEMAGASQYALGWLAAKQNRFETALTEYEKLSSIYPQGLLGTQGEYAQAGSLYSLGKYDEALALYQKVSEEKPMSQITWGARFGMARVYQKKQEKEKALELFQNIVADSDSVQWAAFSQYAIGEYWYERGDLAKARDEYEKVVKNYPDTDTVVLALVSSGWCRFQLQDYDKAWSNLNDAVAKRSAAAMRPWIENLMGDIQFNQKKYENAIKTYDQVMQIAPDSADMVRALMQKGWCYYRLHDDAKAREVWLKIAGQYPDTPEGPQAQYWEAWVLFSANKYDEARVEFQKMLDAYPKQHPLCPDALLHLGDCYYNTAKYDDCIKAYQRFLDAYPQSPKVAEALYGLQWGYAQMGKTQESLEVGKQFLNRYSDHPLSNEVLYYQAEVYLKDNDIKDAIASFSKIVAKAPTSELGQRAQMATAQAYEKGGLDNLALDTYSQIVAKNPKGQFGAEALFHMASINFRGGSYDQALENYQKILDLFPDSNLTVQTLFNLAITYKKMGKAQQALDLWKKVGEKFPQSNLADQALMQSGLMMEDNKDLDQALSYYDKASQSPNRAVAAEALFWMAGCYEKKDSADKAVEVYQKIGDSYKDQDMWASTALAKVAELDIKKGKFDEAAKVYQQIISQTTNKEWSSAAQKRLDALKSQAGSKDNTHAK